MSTEQDMRGPANQDPRKAPANFDSSSSSDAGDVEENLGGGPRGRPGPVSNQYRTATTENQNQAMQIDQRGSQRKGRASSSKRRKSTGRKNANKSYASSEIGGDESRYGDPEVSKDFNSAYAKLVEKIYQEQGNTLLISQDEIYKLEHSKQLNEENFRQRIQEFEDNKRRKLMEQQDALKDKDLEGCTFKPQLVTNSTGDNKRNLDQFIQDQQKFLDKVNKKREEAKQQMAHEEVSIMQPSVDEYSRKIVEEKMSDRKNKATHERLYDLNKELQEKKLKKVQELNQQAKAQTQPHVQQVRDRSELERTLYEDAERRRKDLAKKKEELDKTRDQPKEKYFHNDTSDKYVARKLEREIQQLEQEMAVQNQEEGQQEGEQQERRLLAFNQFQDVLLNLGFLPRDKPTIDAADQQQCQDLWAVLQGEERGGVSWDAFKLVCLNLIGIKTPDHEKTPEGHQEESTRQEVQQEGDEPAEQPENHKKVDITKLAFYEEDIFYLRKNSHKKIFTHFKNLYVNRVQSVGSVKKYTQSTSSPEKLLQAKPQISSKTAKLAQKKREKLLGGRQVTSTVEIFLLPKHNEAFLEERRKQLNEREVDGCTFRPKTLNYQTSQQQESAGFRGETLYQSKPKGWFVEKALKTSSDYEFEKSTQECTFKPSINDPSQLQALQDGANVEQVRGVNKQLERLQKARQQQLEKKLMTERGMPSQLMASLGKPEPTMSFTSNKNKFKSGFGVDGSQIKPPKRQTNFADSQRIDQSQLYSARQSRPQQHHQQQQQQPQRQQVQQQQQQQQQASRQQRQSQQEVQQQQHLEQYHHEEEQNYAHEEEIEQHQIQQQIQQQQQQQQLQRNNSKTGSNRQFEQQQQQQQQQQQVAQEQQHFLHQEQEQEEEQQQEYEQHEVEHEEEQQVVAQYQEEETLQEEHQVVEGMNETDYEGQQFAQHRSSSSSSSSSSHEQSPVKSQTEREPMLYVDVNLGNSGTQRIVVFEGDTAEGLAEKFSLEYNLDESMKEKLTLMLQQQIAGVLEKIEEVQSNNSDNLNNE